MLNNIAYMFKVAMLYQHGHLTAFYVCLLGFYLAWLWISALAPKRFEFYYTLIFIWVTPSEKYDNIL